MKVLSIGTDRKIFEEGSAARARMIEYGALFEELHIIIFSKVHHNLKEAQIAPNVWIYPTHSSNRLLYPFAARRLYKRRLSDLKPDVITTQDPFETGLAGWLIKGITGAKFQIQIHTDFLSKYFIQGSILNRLRVMIAYWLLPKATMIRAVSDRIRQSLSVIDESLPARTIVLPIYTETEKYRDGDIELDLHKQYTQFSFIILMASRLTHEKNIRLALEVMREVVLKHQNVGLVVVGDGPEKRYLQALALRYHLDRNVVFESWQPNLASYYRTADVFLLTSLYEGYGLTLVEAAAAGCPIITTDVGIARELIDEDVTGYVCPVGGAICIREHIVNLIQDPLKEQAIKSHATTLSEKKINMPKSEYLRLYKEMLEQV